MANFRITPALFLMIFCSGVSAEITIENNTATYTGSIEADLNRSLFQQIAGKNITRLVITSDGGDVVAGIALGQWVFDNGIDIEVRDYCLSSCANYVFTAGRNKVIHPGAVVAWHGNYNHLLQTGLWQDDIDYRMQQTGEDRATATQYARELATRLADMERAFFAHIGVDEYICWAGKMPPFNARDYYFLGHEDMVRFGVGNVQLPVNYRETGSPVADTGMIFINLR